MGGIVEAIGSLKVTLGGLLDLGGSVSSCDGSLGLEDTSFNYFSLLRVMTLAFSLGFMMFWEGSLPNPWAWIWLISLAIWPIWYSKLFWDIAKVLTSSSSEEFWLVSVA